MKLFSTSDRKNIKEYIVTLCEKNEEIASILQVGSGAFGYIDELSDLDFCIVGHHADQIEQTMNYLYSGIKERLQIACFEQMLQRGLQVYVLDNYLEIDIGFVSLENVVARRGHWNVIFDRTGTVQTLMEISWRKTKEENHGKTSKTDVKQTYAHYAGSFFHYMFHAAVAIKRKQYWRSIGEMDIARNRLIELKGYRKLSPSGRGKYEPRLHNRCLFLQGGSKP